MKFYITMFNNIIIFIMIIVIYFLNTIDENNLNKRYDIGIYLF